jgi:DNA polymerase III subunit delta
MSVKSSDFLSKKRRGSPPPVIVVAGDEEFLQRECSRLIKEWVLGKDDDDFAYASYMGDQATWASIHDELRTPPFLGDRRLVVIEEADSFVTEHRSLLEAYVAKPSPCGILNLLVRSWPANTKLAKATEETGLAIDASSPKPWLVADWAARWARSKYGKTMDDEASTWLVELAGVNLGQIDQELSKLASFLGTEEAISVGLVDRLVAGTRTDTPFKLLDLVLEGKLAKSLEMLDRQFTAGESPVGVLAMISSQLRRLARGARDTDFGIPTADALKGAGIPPFAIDKARQQLNHFGRPRMETMFRRLLQADLDLKGSSAMAPRTVVERLLVDLARPRR